MSEEPFYVSGKNSQFTIINGVYQPIIQMTVRLFDSAAGASQTLRVCASSVKGRGGILCVSAVSHQPGILVQD